MEVSPEVSAEVAPKVSAEESARRPAWRLSARDRAILRKIREDWEALYAKYPNGPPCEPDRDKAVAEADAIRAAIRARHPGPFPDSTEEIRRSRDADWGEEDEDVDS